MKINILEKEWIKITIMEHFGHSDFGNGMLQNLLEREVGVYFAAYYTLYLNP